jgi:hypothetical protein
MATRAPTVSSRLHVRLSEAVPGRRPRGDSSAQAARAPASENSVDLPPSLKKSGTAFEKVIVIDDVVPSDRNATSAVAPDVARDFALGAVTLQSRQMLCFALAALCRPQSPVVNALISFPVLARRPRRLEAARDRYAHLRL